MRRSLLLLLTLALIGSASACGGSDGSAVGDGKVESAGVRLPSQVLGLQVTPEDVSEKLKEARRAYVDSMGLFSFRENDLVRATLQVSKFNRLARPNDPDFRRQFTNLIGNTAPQELRVDDQTVYATSGNEQAIFVWFEGRGFLVLTAHRDYEFPRKLLRSLVEIDSGL